jgi:hypothetical protein
MLQNISRNEITDNATAFYFQNIINILIIHSYQKCVIEYFILGDFVLSVYVCMAAELVR